MSAHTQTHNWPQMHVHDAKTVLQTVDNLLPTYARSLSTFHHPTATFVVYLSFRLNPSGFLPPSLHLSLSPQWETKRKHLENQWKSATKWLRNMFTCRPVSLSKLNSCFESGHIHLQNLWFWGLLGKETFRYSKYVFSRPFWYLFYVCEHSVLSDSTNISSNVVL